jgi:hypothetical protein
MTQACVMSESATPPQASRPSRLLIFARVLLALQAAVLIVLNGFQGLVLTLLSFVGAADSWQEAQGRFWTTLVFVIVVVLASCVVGPGAFVLSFQRRWWAPVLIAIAEVLIILEPLYLGFSTARADEGPLWPYLVVAAVPAFIGILVTAPSSVRRYFARS